ncbi:TRAP transporter small permease subunit [Pseudomonadales bacterium]|nr:TRAP transporter small permease subunit [Pseudomonadales bacterium]
MRNQHARIAQLVGIIDRFTLLSGHWVAWLLMVMVIIQSLVVVFRYGFDSGSIAWQESVTYLHAAIFLLGAAYTLQCDEHVRVDIFYRDFSSVKKAKVNLLGFVCFLLPMCGYIIWESLSYVMQAWSIKESSANSDGLHEVYLLKTLIPVFASMLILQGFAEALRSFLILSGQPLPASDDHDPTAAI